LLGGRYDAFKRAFRMPMIVDQAKIHATYHNGVLALRLPEHAAAIP
jgi:HSP20 family molecular chaperone IbpA